MPEPVLLIILAMIAVIGLVIGVIAAASTAGTRPRRIAFDVGCGALAALAIGFPAVSFGTQGLDLIGDIALLGSPEPLLLPLGAYLSGAATSIGLGRFLAL